MVKNEVHHANQTHQDEELSPSKQRFGVPIYDVGYSTPQVQQAFWTLQASSLRYRHDYFPFRPYVVYIQHLLAPQQIILVITAVILAVFLFVGHAYYTPMIRSSDIVEQLSASFPPQLQATPNENASIAPIMESSMVTLAIHPTLSRTTQTYVVPIISLAMALLALLAAVGLACFHTARDYLEYSRPEQLLQANWEFSDILPSLSRFYNTQGAPHAPASVRQTDAQGQHSHHVNTGLPVIPQAIKTIPVLRDGQWLQWPLNMVIRGDIVYLPPGEPVPCEVLSLPIVDACELIQHLDAHHRAHNEASRYHDYTSPSSHAQSPMSSVHSRHGAKDGNTLHFQHSVDMANSLSTPRSSLFYHIDYTREMSVMHHKHDSDDTATPALPQPSVPSVSSPSGIRLHSAGTKRTGGRPITPYSSDILLLPLLDADELERIGFTSSEVEILLQLFSRDNDSNPTSPDFQTLQQSMGTHQQKSRHQDQDDAAAAVSERDSKPYGHRRYIDANIANTAFHPDALMHASAPHYRLRRYHHPFPFLPSDSCLLQLATPILRAYTASDMTQTITWVLQNQCVSKVPSYIYEIQPTAPPPPPRRSDRGEHTHYHQQSALPTHQLSGVCQHYAYLLAFMPIVFTKNSIPNAVHRQIAVNLHHHNDQLFSDAWLEHTHHCPDGDDCRYLSVSNILPSAPHTPQYSPEQNSPASDTSSYSYSSSHRDQVTPLAHCGIGSINSPPPLSRASRFPLAHWLDNLPDQQADMPESICLSSLLATRRMSILTQDPIIDAPGGSIAPDRVYIILEPPCFEQIAATLFPRVRQPVIPEAASHAQEPQKAVSLSNHPPQPPPSFHRQYPNSSFEYDPHDIFGDYADSPSTYLAGLEIAQAQAPPLSWTQHLYQEALPRVQRLLLVCTLALFIPIAMVRLFAVDHLHHADGSPGFSVSSSNTHYVPHLFPDIDGTPLTTSTGTTFQTIVTILTPFLSTLVTLLLSIACIPGSTILSLITLFNNAYFFDIAASATILSLRKERQQQQQHQPHRTKTSDDFDVQSKLPDDQQPTSTTHQEGSNALNAGAGSLSSEDEMTLADDDTKIDGTNSSASHDLDAQGHAASPQTFNMNPPSLESDEDYTGARSSMPLTAHHHAGSATSSASMVPSDESGITATDLTRLLIIGKNYGKLDTSSILRDFDGLTRLVDAWNYVSIVRTTHGLIQQVLTVEEFIEHVVSPSSFQPVGSADILSSFHQTYTPLSSREHIERLKTSYTDDGFSQSYAQQYQTFLDYMDANTPAPVASPLVVDRITSLITAPPHHPPLGQQSLDPSSSLSTQQSAQRGLLSSQYHNYNAYVPAFIHAYKLAPGANMKKKKHNGAKPAFSAADINLTTAMQNDIQWKETTPYISSFIQSENMGLAQHATSRLAFLRGLITTLKQFLTQGSLESSSHHLPLANTGLGRHVRTRNHASSQQKHVQQREIATKIYDLRILYSILKKSTNHHGLFNSLFTYYGYLLVILLPYLQNSRVHGVDLLRTLDRLNEFQQEYEDHASRYKASSSVTPSVHQDLQQQRTEPVLVPNSRNNTHSQAVLVPLTLHTVSASSDSSATASTQAFQIYFEQLVERRMNHDPLYSLGLIDPLDKKLFNAVARYAPFADPKQPHGDRPEAVMQSNSNVDGDALDSAHDGSYLSFSHYNWNITAIFARMRDYHARLHQSSDDDGGQQRTKGQEHAESVELPGILSLRPFDWCNVLGLSTFLQATFDLGIDLNNNNNNNELDSHTSVVFTGNPALITSSNNTLHQQQQQQQQQQHSAPFTSAPIHDSDAPLLLHHWLDNLLTLVTTSLSHSAQWEAFFSHAPSSTDSSQPGSAPRPRPDPSHHDLMQAVSILQSIRHHQLFKIFLQIEQLVASRKKRFRQSLFITTKLMRKKGSIRAKMRQELYSALQLRNQQERTLSSTAAGGGFGHDQLQQYNPAYLLALESSSSSDTTSSSSQEDKLTDRAAKYRPRVVMDLHNRIGGGDEESEVTLSSGFSFLESSSTNRSSTTLTSSSSSSSSVSSVSRVSLDDHPRGMGMKPIIQDTQSIIAPLPNQGLLMTPPVKSLVARQSNRPPGSISGPLYPNPVLDIPPLALSTTPITEGVHHERQRGTQRVLTHDTSHLQKQPQHHHHHHHGAAHHDGSIRSKPHMRTPPIEANYLHQHLPVVKDLYAFHDSNYLNILDSMSISTFSDMTLSTTTSSSSSSSSAASVHSSNVTLTPNTTGRRPHQLISMYSGLSESTTTQTHMSSSQTSQGALQAVSSAGSYQAPFTTTVVSDSRTIESELEASVTFSDILSYYSDDPLLIFRHDVNVLTSSSTSSPSLSSSSSGSRSRSPSRLRLAAPSPSPFVYVNTRSFGNSLQVDDDHASHVHSQDTDALTDEVVVIPIQPLGAKGLRSLAGHSHTHEYSTPFMTRRRGRGQVMDVDSSSSTSSSTTSASSLDSIYFPYDYGSGDSASDHMSITPLKLFRVNTLESYSSLSSSSSSSVSFSTTVVTPSTSLYEGFQLSSTESSTSSHATTTIGDEFDSDEIPSLTRLMAHYINTTAHPAQQYGLGEQPVTIPPLQPALLLPQDSTGFHDDDFDHSPELTKIIIHDVDQQRLSTSILHNDHHDSYSLEDDPAHEPVHHEHEYGSQKSSQTSVNPSTDHDDDDISGSDDSGSDNEDTLLEQEQHMMIHKSIYNMLHVMRPPIANAWYIFTATTLSPLLAVMGFLLCPCRQRREAPEQQPSSLSSPPDPSETLRVQSLVHYLPLPSINMVQAFSEATMFAVHSRRGILTVPSLTPHHLVVFDEMNKTQVIDIQPRSTAIRRQTEQLHDDPLPLLDSGDDHDHHHHHHHHIEGDIFATNTDAANGDGSPQIMDNTHLVNSTSPYHIDMELVHKFDSVLRPLALAICLNSPCIIGRHHRCDDMCLCSLTQSLGLDVRLLRFQYPGALTIEDKIIPHGHHLRMMASQYSSESGSRILRVKEACSVIVTNRETTLMHMMDMMAPVRNYLVHLSMHFLKTHQLFSSLNIATSASMYSMNTKASIEPAMHAVLSSLNTLNQTVSTTISSSSSLPLPITTSHRHAPSWQGKLQRYQHYAVLLTKLWIDSTNLFHLLSVIPSLQATVRRHYSALTNYPQHLLPVIILQAHHQLGHDALRSLYILRLAFLLYQLEYLSTKARRLAAFLLDQYELLTFALQQWAQAALGSDPDTDTTDENVPSMEVSTGHDSQRSPVLSLPPLETLLQPNSLQTLQATGHILFLKGDVDIVFGQSTHFWNGIESVPMDEHYTQSLLELCQVWEEQQAMTIMAFGYAPLSDETAQELLFSPSNTEA